MATTDEKPPPRNVRFTEPDNKDTANNTNMTSGTIETGCLMEQNIDALNIDELSPTTPEVISRQATINVGTIGHVAHGKSTVVKSITGTNTVRFKREHERNITIKLGYANAKLYKIDYESIDESKKEGKTEKEFESFPNYYTSRPSQHADVFTVDDAVTRERYGQDAQYKCLRHVSFVDCPGHDILMATMLTGAAIMDAALLLIAANETCPQPQTKEHIAAIEIMKLKHIIILQNKIDLVAKDDALQQHEDIKEFARGYLCEQSPIVPISAQLKLNIDIVCQLLVRNIPLPIRDYKKSPRLSIIRSFDINKPGTEVDDLEGGIAGGSILQGILKIGDEIEIRPGVSFKNESGQWMVRPLQTRIVSLSSEKNKLQYAVPGGLIGVGTNLDPSLCRANHLVGNILGRVGMLPEVYDLIEISFHLMTRLVGQQTGGAKNNKITPLVKKELLNINIGSCETTAEVTQVANEDICRLKLNKVICTEDGEKVSLQRRIDRHWRLIGWGTIIKGHSVKLMD